MYPPEKVWEVSKALLFVSFCIVHPIISIINGILCYLLSFHALAMEIKYSDDEAQAGIMTTTFIIRSIAVIFYFIVMFKLGDSEHRVPKWKDACNS